MKGIQQRGPYTYRFTVSVGFDGNGKHIRKTMTFKVPEGTAPTKAEKMVKEAYTEFSNKCKGMKSLNENMRFKELVEIYFKIYAPNELKPATSYNYDKDLKRHMLPVFGNKKLKDIMTEDISTFLTNLNLSGETTRKMKTILSSVFSFGVRQGYIKTNPCVNSIYKKEKGLKKVNYYNKQQCKQLMELTNGYSKFNYIIQFLLFTGLRCGECLGLRWCDVDFENDIISINNTLTYANKEWFLTQPKTVKSIRVLKLSTYAKQLLLKHKEEQDKEKSKVGNAWLHSEMVFTSCTGNFYDRSLLNTQFRRFLKKNEMPKLTIHGLRHSNASLMINNGFDVKIVSEHLGHCNVSITADIYSHIFEEYKAKVAQAIEYDLI